MTNVEIISPKDVLTPLVDVTDLTLTDIDDLVAVANVDMGGLKVDGVPLFHDETGYPTTETFLLKGTGRIRLEGGELFTAIIRAVARAYRTAVDSKEITCRVITMDDHHCPSADDHEGTPTFVCLQYGDCVFQVLIDDPEDEVRWDLDSIKAHKVPLDRMEHFEVAAQYAVYCARLARIRAGSDEPLFRNCDDN